VSLLRPYLRCRSHNEAGLAHPGSLATIPVAHGDLRRQLECVGEVEAAELASGDFGDDEVAALDRALGLLRLPLGGRLGSCVHAERGVGSQRPERRTGSAADASRIWSATNLDASDPFGINDPEIGEHRGPSGLLPGERELRPQKPSVVRLTRDGPRPGAAEAGEPVPHGIAGKRRRSAVAHKHG
jgi:hypothetical protein